MPGQVWQVLGLYLVTTMVYIGWIIKANRELDEKLSQG
jgi:hypothetical protein